MAGETFSFADQFGYEEEPASQDPHAPVEDLPLNQRFEEDPDAWSFAKEFGYEEEPEPPAAPEEESGYFENIGRGMAGRAAALGAGLAEGSAWAYEKLGESTGLDTSGIVDGLRNVSQSGRDAQTGYYGYDAERNSWEDLKKDFSGESDAGFWETTGNTIAFGIEQGSVSIPDMVAAVTMLPAYITMRTGEIAYDRAQADGRDEMTATDILVGSATATAVSVLEKFGADKILKVAPTGSLLTGTAKGAGVGGASEGTTEFLQEALEYTGVNLATKEGFEFAGMVDQALAGMVGGGTFGTAAGGVSGGVQSVVEKRQADADAAMKAIEDAQKRAEEAAAEAGGDALDQAQAGEEAARAAREQYYAAQAERLSEEQLQAAEEEEVRVRAQEQAEAAERYTAEPDTTPTTEEAFEMAETEAAQVRAEEEAEARYQAELQEGEIVEKMEDVTVEPEKLGTAQQETLAKAKAQIQKKEKVAKILAKKKASDKREAATARPKPKMLEDKSPDIVVNSQGKAMKPGDMGAQPADFVVDPAGNALNRAQILRERRRMEVDAAAGETPLKPSELKVERRVGNIKIAMETLSGMKRTGLRADGSKWSTVMRGVDYGFIRGSKGADGDQVDVFINSEPDATYDKVFVIDQLDQNTGTFDEHKVVMGFPNQMAAVKAYKKQYQAGWKVGPVTEMTQAEFEEWSKAGKKDEAIADVPQAATEADIEALAERARAKSGKKPKILFKLPEGTSVQMHEQAMPELGLNSLFLESVDETGAPIGSIDAVEFDDTKEIKINTSAVNPDRKGQGIGIHMYNQLMERAADQGYDLVSDVSVSPDAQRMYEALERRGAEVWVNPNATVNERGGMVSDEIGTPVFRVKPSKVRLKEGDLDDAVRQSDVQPVDADEVADSVAMAVSFLPGLGEMGKDVQVLARPEDADPDVYESIKEEDGLDAKGAYVVGTGQVLIFTDNLDSFEEGMETLLHEGVAHKGLRVVLGDRLNSLLDDVWEKGDQAAIKSIAKRYKYDISKPVDRRKSVEEYVAHLAERNPQAGVLRKIIDAIRGFLRDAGVLKSWTDDDIHALLRDVRRGLRYTPLDKINIPTEAMVEETGEVVTYDERADVLLRQLEKRRSVVDKLKGCLAA